MRFLPSVLFVFLLCFVSFLLGWGTAVFVIPGGMAKKTDLKASSLVPGRENLPPSKEGKNPAFFTEMKDNILFLFDPYKMDSFIKGTSSIKGENSPFKPRPVKLAPIKNLPPPQKKMDPAPAVLNPSLPPPEKMENFEWQKLQEEYDKKNRAQLIKIAGNQKFFTIDGKFSFLIDVFSEQEKALDYIQEMKKFYPLWSFLIKAHSGHVRVYLGPFPSKQKALEFKKSIPEPSPFSQIFLEEVSL